MAVGHRDGRRLGSGKQRKGDPLDALDTGFYKSLGKELRNLQVKTMDVDSPTTCPAPSWTKCATTGRTRTARWDTCMGDVTWFA